MTYEQIKNLRETEFKHLCGVKPQLFKKSQVKPVSRIEILADKGYQGI